MKLPGGAGTTGPTKEVQEQMAGKLVKLLSQMDRLKKQIANPLDSPENKAKLKRKMEILEEKIKRTRGTGIDNSMGGDS